MDKPLVSIMMPAYNVEQYIGQAIESCLSQTYENLELCIVDDGSTDNTWDIIRSYNDPRIKGDGLVKNYGEASARNQCLKISEGDIIARQDSDDYQDPTRIEKSVNRLLDDRSRPLVTCQMYWVTDGKSTPYKESKGMDYDLYIHRSGGHPVNGSIVAWKEVYDRAGPFNEELNVASDGVWNFEALKHYKQWQFIDEYLYYYRRHSEQLSKRRTRAQFVNHEKARAEFLRTYELSDL